MGKKKDEYFKPFKNKKDLRKMKISNEIKFKKIVSKENFFASENQDIVLENLHKKGVIVGADFSGEEFGQIDYVKIYLDSKQHDLVNKKLNMDVVRTNGIGRWHYCNEHNGAKRTRSYSTFYPDRQVSTDLIGERVLAESKDSVVLDNSTIAERVQNLCALIDFVEPETALKIREQAEFVMEKYVVNVIMSSKLYARDREYLMEIFENVKNAPITEMVSKFMGLKREMQRKISQMKSGKKN